MQFLIDTATDEPSELYKIGRFLIDTFETVPFAPVGEVTDETQVAHSYGADALAAIKDAPLPVAPPPPVPGNTDVEIDTDEEGPVESLTAVVELPTAPPPPPGPAVAPELDSRGLPWDGRIHASNRAKKIDGAWKNKRGVDVAMISQIEGAPAAPAAPLVTAAPPPPAPAAPSVVTAPAPPSTASAPTVVDFRGLMQKIQAATQAGKLSTEQVTAALAGVGLKPEEMSQLINNAPLIASVNAAVEAHL